MLQKLLSGQVLTFDEAAQFMRQVMSDQVSPVRLSAALAALRVRGEAPEEIAGFASTMRELAIPVKVKAPLVMDIVGTGGDSENPFNISTTTIFVVSTAGVTVAKHGNRAASSKSGSADLLEACGVNLNASPETIEKAINTVGVGFLFARSYHPAMRFAAPVRAELGVRTVFNLLGPLTNPARPTHQVVGVSSPHLVPVFAQVLQKLGLKRGIVVYGDGLDEFTTCGPNLVAELKDGEIHEYTLEPESVGLRCVSKTEIQGGDAQHNAEITRDVLGGQGTQAQRDIVALNAGIALYVSGQQDSIQAGIQKAIEVLDSGEALQKLQAYAALTQQ